MPPAGSLFWNNHVDEVKGVGSMRNRAPSVTVYYDGWCPLCSGIQDRLLRMDWLGKLAFASMREPGVAESLGVPAGRLAERMHVRVHRTDGTGQVVDGIQAVLAIAARIPLLWPLWPLIWLSAVTSLGGWLYDLIAARRTIIPVGACDENGCPIHRD